MLILSRQCDDKVLIRVPAGDQERLIEVLVVDVRGDRVRLGFEAADDIVIERDDIKTVRK